MEFQGQQPESSAEKNPLKPTDKPQPETNPHGTGTPGAAAETTTFAEVTLPPIPAPVPVKDPLPAKETPQTPALAAEPAVAGDKATPSAGKPAKWSADQYYDPKPSSGLIKFLGVMNDWIMLRGLPVLRHIPLINRIPLVGRGLLKFVDVDLPKADEARFKEVVNRKTAAFLSPNHPEFVTDWIIDKEVSRRVSPLMAHWADVAIVNMHPLTQKFWLKNNLIANVRKGGGKDYSVNWAQKGHGVLLHPEGMVSWSGNKVYQIYPGIVDMAAETVQKIQQTEHDKGRPVYIVPFVSKYRFVEDVSRGLNREMKAIEKRLGVPVRSDLPVHERFFELNKNILLKQEERFGVPPELRAEPLTAANYFTRQTQLFDKLNAEVEGRYGQGHGTEHRKIFHLESVIRKAKEIDKSVRNEDQARLKEMRRLLEFSPELYGREKLTQEEMAESLKRIKRDLVNATTMERVNNYIPIAVGRRTAHVRIVEPINVSEAIEAGGDTPEVRAELLQKVRDNMQVRLEALARELEPHTSKYARPNPFFAGPEREQTH